MEAGKLSCKIWQSFTRPMALSAWTLKARNLYGYENITTVEMVAYWN